MNIHVCEECHMEFPEGSGFDDPCIHKCVRDKSSKAQEFWECYDEIQEEDN